MYLRLGRVKVHITFLFAASVAFFLNSGKGETLLTVFAGALIHECAHLCFLLSYGAKDVSLEIHPGGARIKGGGFDALSHKQSLICVLAGPCVNLTLGAVLYLLSGILRATPLFDAAGINLALGAVNLIPLSFLDGGRALACLIAIKKRSPPPDAAWGRSDIAITAVLLSVSAVLTLKRTDAAFLTVFSLYCAAAVSRRRLRRASAPRYP